MEKIAQKFKVNDQIITKANSPVLVADSVGIIEFAFEFSDLWDDVGKTAVITTGGETFNCAILNGVVSAQNMPVLKAGVCKVSVFGGDLITANEAKVTLQVSGLINGTAPPPTTPDVYAQLVAEFERLRVLASNSATNANTSETNSADSATAAKKNADLAEEYAKSAKQLALSANASAEKAQTSADNASASEKNAEKSAQSAKDSEDSAKADAKSAHDFAQAAEEFAEKAQSAIPVGGTKGQVLAKESDDDYATEWAELPKTASPFWQKTGNVDVAEMYPVGGSNLDVEVTIADVDRSAVSPSNPIAIPSYGGVEVVRCGRNVINAPFTTETVNGVTFTANSDGGITLNGTATGDIFKSVRSTFMFKKGERYTLSIKNTKATAGGSGNLFRITGPTQGTTIIELRMNVIDQKATFTAPNNVNVYDLRFRLAAGDTFDDFTVYPTLNFGSTALPYEPYNGDTFTISTDTVYPNDVVMNSGEVLHNMGHYVADSGWNVTATTVYGENTRFEITIPNFTVLYNGSTTACYCNAFLASYTHTIGAPSTATRECFFPYSNNKVYFIVNQNSIVPKTAVEFKQWLINNKIEVACKKLATTTQLPTTKIASLAQADKYTPEFNQCFSNAGQIQVGYNKDSVAVYNELTSAILST